MKIDKEKFIISLLKQIPESSDLDEAILNTLSKLKIDESVYYDIKNELFPKGLNSLMYQLNLLINKRLSNEKKPLRFKSFRVNEKVKYFTMRRLMIFESLVNKKSFFGKLFKPNLLLNSNKVLFKIADEIWFLSGFGVRSALLPPTNTVLIFDLSLRIVTSWLGSPSTKIRSANFPSAIIPVSP